VFYGRVLFLSEDNQRGWFDDVHRCPACFTACEWSSKGPKEIAFRLCVRCERPFTQRLRWRWGRGRAHFCSTACATSYHAQRRKAARARAREGCWCAECQASFEPSRSDGRYCSPACRQRAYRRRQHEVAEEAAPRTSGEERTPDVDAGATQRRGAATLVSPSAAPEVSPPWEVASSSRPPCALSGPGAWCRT
jgi:hypothetical protein